MTNVNCYHCNSDQSVFYASENGFTLVKCSQCGLLYVNPRPDETEIDQAALVGKHSGEKTIDVTGSFQAKKTKTYLKILADFFPKGLSNDDRTWLDIGCGHGEFLLALKQFGEDQLVVKGFEPNVFKQNSARERNLDLVDTGLDQHDEQYDVISCLNVYSHLPDPPKAIEDWKRFLKKGGGLLIETGDTAGLSSKDQHRPFYLPDHLSFASQAIIVQILENSGFEVIEIKKYPSIDVGLRLVIREFVKMFWPNKKSRFMSIINRNNAISKTDMYIWARLRRQH